MPSAAVIGAGPVGCLTAIGLAQRGYEVILYEARPAEAFSGIHLQTNAKSINLAISTRGMTALSAVDHKLTETVLNNAVPVRARMIHSKPSSSIESSSQSPAKVRLESQLYSDKGDCIYSVSRNLLNRILLDAVIERGIPIRWSHKLLRAELNGWKTERVSKYSSGGASSSPPLRDDQVKLFFEGSQSSAQVCAVDLLVGCDGHHSKVRSELSRTTEMDFSQRYIDNYYTELHIPVSKLTGDFALDPDHLHIWPRHDFMLMALANQDKTFTSTLFAPKRIYADHLNDEGRLLAFFRTEFPDALRFIGEEQLVNDLVRRRPSPLATIECKPYHYQGRAIFLGDAAHAMVPFYGQGLNCGLEDVRIMLERMDEHASQDANLSEDALCTSSPSSSSSRSNSPWPRNSHSRVDSGAVMCSRRSSATQASKAEAFTAHQEAISALSRARAFAEYSTSRHDNLRAISQLALDNYYEMSSKVVSKPYLLRKKLDSFLSRNLPENWWNSLYTLVTFSNIGYYEAQQTEARQRKLLNAVGLSTITSFSLGAVYLGYRLAKSIL